MDSDDGLKAVTGVLGIDYLDVHAIEQLVRQDGRDV